MPALNIPNEFFKELDAGEFPSWDDECISIGPGDNDSIDTILYIRHLGPSESTRKVRSARLNIIWEYAANSRIIIGKDSKKVVTNSVGSK